MIFQVDYLKYLIFLSPLLFFLSFNTKTAKVIFVHKKDCKPDFRSYCPVSLLSNIEKILEGLINGRNYKFLSDNNGFR